MRDAGKLLIIAGLFLVVVGVAVTFGSRFGLGRLPGDFVFKRGNATFYFPLVTSIILSLALTLVLWLFRR